jgi:hypothetical protein
VLIDTSANSQMVRYLRENAQPVHAHSGYAVDGFEVRTHPDLVSRLRDFMAYTPGARLEYAFGTPTLCTADGEIFATASGTSSLHLYLPNVTDWGWPFAEYGHPWRQGSAWNRLPSQTDEDFFGRIARAAYAYASHSAGKRTEDLEAQE